MQVASFSDDDSILLREMDKRFKASDIPMRLVGDLGRSSALVRSQDAEKAKMIINSVAWSLRVPLIFVKEPIPGKE